MGVAYQDLPCSVLSDLMGFDISDKKMDVEYVFTASAIILGIFTVILQVVSYLLLSGTIAYMTISGIWGGFATIVAAMAAQKKHFLKSQACAILAIVGCTVMIGPYYWSFENNFPRFEFDCSQYWKGFCKFLSRYLLDGDMADPVRTGRLLSLNWIMFLVRIQQIYGMQFECWAVFQFR